jgi:PAT family beta-lactamase induction signal transducer AmpG
MAAIMGVAIVTVLLIAEPIVAKGASAKTLDPGSLIAKLRQAVLEPLLDFFKRNGRLAILLLLFIGFYRLSDITMGIMANPFYLELGFTKTEIGQVVKLFGIFMTMAGTFLCGSLVVRYGFYGPLLAGAIMVALTNILFSTLASIGPDLTWLAIVISADNLSGGIATTALVAYLSSLTNRTYTATQYALFSSLMTLPGKFLSGFSGFVVDASSYSTFFLVAAALGIPAIILVLMLISNREKIESNVAAVH